MLKVIEVEKFYSFESDTESHINGDELSELSCFEDENDHNLVVEEEDEEFEVSKPVVMSERPKELLSIDDIPYDRDLRYVNVPVASRPRPQGVLFDVGGSSKILKQVRDITGGNAHELKELDSHYKKLDDKKRQVEKKYIKGVTEDEKKGKEKESAANRKERGKNGRDRDRENRETFPGKEKEHKSRRERDRERERDRNRDRPRDRDPDYVRDTAEEMNKVFDSKRESPDKGLGNFAKRNDIPTTSLSPPPPPPIAFTASRSQEFYDFLPKKPDFDSTPHRAASQSQQVSASSSIMQEAALYHPPRSSYHRNNAYRVPPSQPGREASQYRVRQGGRAGSQRSYHDPVAPEHGHAAATAAAAYEYDHNYTTYYDGYTESTAYAAEEYDPTQQQQQQGATTYDQQHQHPPYSSVTSSYYRDSQYPSRGTTTSKAYRSSTYYPTTVGQEEYARAEYGTTSTTIGVEGAPVDGNAGATTWGDYHNYEYDGYYASADANAYPASVKKGIDVAHQHQGYDAAYYQPQKAAPTAPSGGNAVVDTAGYEKSNHAPAVSSELLSDANMNYLDSTLNALDLNPHAHEFVPTFLFR